MEQKCCCCCGGQDERILKAKEIIEKFRCVDGGLMPAMQQIQNLYGYLPEEVLHMVSEGLDVPMTEIYGVATFYSFFSLTPKGKHIIRICLGTACYVRGADLVFDKLQSELKVGAGETTEDGKFTLEGTRCLGACGLAPVMMIDEKVYGSLKAEDIPEILKEYD